MSRRLHDVGVFGRIRFKKPLISKKNQKARLKFAQKYEHWTPKQWSKVLFLTNQNLIFLEVREKSLFDVQKTQDMILGIKF